jgi:pimeloyl-ACP methyl ester carboxylesterase
LVDHSDSPREQASRLIALLFPPQLAGEIDRQFGELVAGARAKLSLATLSAQEAAMEAWHREEQTAPDASASPALVLHGTEDVVIPSANAEVLAARWPGARVELFEGCAHAVMAQEPAAIAATIRDHVSRYR